MFGTNTFAQVPFSAASGFLLLAAVADTAIVQDTFASTANFAPVVIELVVATDQTAAQFSIFSNADETAVAADTASSLYFVNADLSDSAVLSDASSANVTFRGALSDAATAFETFSARAVFPVAVFESLLVLDNLVGRELWEQIDDTQTAGWTDILVPRTIEAIAVFGDSNFGVLSYAGNITQRYNPNPTIWDDIDDTADTVWTDIEAV